MRTTALSDGVKDTLLGARELLLHRAAASTITSRTAASSRTASSSRSASAAVIRGLTANEWHQSERADTQKSD
jgi:hypothetical protein